MRISFVITMIALLAGCGAKVGGFKKIRSTMTNEEIFAMVGKPYKDDGSGIFILHWRMDNREYVIRTTGNHVFSVTEQDLSITALPIKIGPVDENGKVIE
jgi:hypothetical protein